MLLLFVVGVLGEDSVPESVPRNYFTSKLFSGSWELSSSAVSNEAGVTLVSGSSQTRHGYAWALKRAPNSTWKSVFRFAVPNPVAVVEGGIFLTDFGAKGEFFGGPSRFSGGVVLFRVENRSVVFSYECGDTSKDLIFSPKVTLPLETGFGFQVFLGMVDNDTLEVIASTATHNAFIRRGVTECEIRKTWISVNAHCPSAASELVMKGANISFVETDDPPKEEEWEAYRPFRRSAFDSRSGLKHREFEWLSRALVRVREDGPVFVEGDGVFGGIVEIGTVLNQSAKIGSTRKLVEKIVQTYADSWGRRCFRMVNQSQSLRSSLENQLGVIQDSLDDFRMKVSAQFRKMKSESRQFHRELHEQILLDAQSIQVVLRNRAFASLSLARVLYIISVVEIAFVLAFAARTMRKVK